MNDTDLDALLAQADEWQLRLRPLHAAQLIADLAAAVRHLRDQNKVAFDIIRRQLDGWYRLPGAAGNWWQEPLDGRGAPKHEAVIDAEKSLLASIQGADDD